MRVRSHCFLSCVSLQPFFLSFYDFHFHSVCSWNNAMLNYRSEMTSRELTDVIHCSSVNLFSKVYNTNVDIGIKMNLHYIMQSYEQYNQTWVWLHVEILFSIKTIGGNTYGRNLGHNNNRSLSQISSKQRTPEGCDSLTSLSESNGTINECKPLHHEKDCDCSWFFFKSLTYETFNLVRFDFHAVHSSPSYVCFYFC